MPFFAKSTLKIHSALKASQLRQLDMELPPALRDALDRATSRAQTAITLIEGRAALAVFAVADAIREESREAVQRLHDQGIE